MNAYQVYLEKQRQDQIRQAADEALRAYVEHMDLVILTMLRNEFGFGPKRLEQALRAAVDTYRRYHRIYLLQDADNKFRNGVERDDTYALKKQLREAGFDFDVISKKIAEEFEQKD